MLAKSDVLIVFFYVMHVVQAGEVKASCLYSLYSVFAMVHLCCHHHKHRSNGEDRLGGCLLLPLEPMVIDSLSLNIAITTTGSPTRKL